jgi:predicted MarR family transcription regulator
MLSEERYAELIAMLEPHVAATTSTSVACYALAEAYAAQKRWQRATPMARRALQLDELDNLLTSRELARAQNLRSGPPP